MRSIVIQPTIAGGKVFRFLCAPAAAVRWLSLNSARQDKKEGIERHTDHKKAMRVCISAPLSSFRAENAEGTEERGGEDGDGGSEHSHFTQKVIFSPGNYISLKVSNHRTSPCRSRLL